MKRKRIGIIALTVALGEEKGYSRFRTLAEMLSVDFDVDLITSSFQHWEKKQRNKNEIKAMKTPYRILLADEPGYKKNVDLRRIVSHRVASKNIMKILKSNHYDLLYCIIPDNFIASNVGKYAKQNGIKFIIDVEDLWPEAMEMVSPFPKKITSILLSSYRKAAKDAYKCADAFVGTSDEYRDVPSVKYGVHGKPSITVYVGCDLDDFDSGVQENIGEINKSDDEFWVTYAGNLGSSYDIPTLIRAAQDLYKDYPSIKVKILGGGPLENEFKRIASEKDCQVEFIGYKPYRYMAAYLTKSDVLVNSFVRKAPQSIVTKIGDYLAAGKPMINTLSSPEFRKKVEKDKFGVNVIAENSSELKKCVVELSNNPQKCIEMGKAARAIAETEFDRKTSYNQIKLLIDSLL